MHGEEEPRDEADRGTSDQGGEEGEGGSRGGRPEHVDRMEPVRARADAVVERVRNQYDGAPQHAAEAAGPVRLRQNGGERPRVLQGGPLLHDPVIVLDEPVPDRRRGHERRHEPRCERRLAAPELHAVTPWREEAARRRRAVARSAAARARRSPDPTGTAPRSCARERRGGGARNSRPPPRAGSAPRATTPRPPGRRRGTRGCRSYGCPRTRPCPLFPRRGAPPARAAPPARR